SRRIIRTGTSICRPRSTTCPSSRRRPSTTSSAAPRRACSSCRRATRSRKKTSSGSAISPPRPESRRLRASAASRVQPGGGLVSARRAFTALALLRAALDAQLDRSYTRNDDDERNDLDHAQRRDRAVAAALLPHGQTDGSEHMGAGTDEEDRRAELAHRQHENVNPA